MLNWIFLQKKKEDKNLKFVANQVVSVDIAGGNLQYLQNRESVL